VGSSPVFLKTYGSEDKKKSVFDRWHKKIKITSLHFFCWIRIISTPRWLQYCRSQTEKPTTTKKHILQFCFQKISEKSEERIKMSFYPMCEHFGEDKWLGQKKLPAMIVWKKNLKKSPSCINHWKTDSLSDSLSLSLTWAIRPEAVGIKKRKSQQKRDDGRHFEIERWKEKKVLLLLLWFDGQETEIRKKPENQKKNHHLFTTLNHYHHQLSSNFFGSKPLERIKDL